MIPITDERSPNRDHKTHRILAHYKSLGHASLHIVHPLLDKNPHPPTIHNTCCISGWRQTIPASGLRLRKTFAIKGCMCRLNRYQSGGRVYLQRSSGRSTSLHTRVESGSIAKSTASTCQTQCHWHRACVGGPQQRYCTA